MNNIFSKLKRWLAKNNYLLAAFLVPLIIRCIPEVLSGPYPLGLDTLNIMPNILSGSVFSLGLVGILHTTSMLYLITGVLYGSTQNVVLVIKLLGPLLLAVLCSAMFLYAKKGLNWSNHKSLLVAILTATYFVALRNSWDLYRQTLGLIFLVAVLISLKSYSSPRKYFIAGAFMVLTVFTHELATIILFLIILIETIQFFIKKSIKEAIYLLISAALAGLLFLFQRIQLTPNVSNAGGYISSGPSVDFALLVAGLVVYCYIIILPLVLIGLVNFKTSAIHYWALICTGFVLLGMVVNPSLPLFFWNRWVYLLVYPFLFFAVNGLDNIWKFSSRLKSKIAKLAPKFFATAFVLLILVFSGFYLTTTPENSFSYFSQNNPYLWCIPSSMLQNTVSISDNPSLFNCIQWLNQNASANSTIITHYALENFMSIYLWNLSFISVGLNTTLVVTVHNETVVSDLMVNSARSILTSNSSANVYTVWWISGKGWYGIPSLPIEFREVFHSGNMAVYLYDPSV